MIFPHAALDKTAARAVYSSLRLLREEGEDMTFTRSEAGKLGYEKTQERMTRCREQQQATARSAYEANPPRCAFCDSRLPYEKRKNKYCDHSCAAKQTNLGVTRNPKKHERRTNCLKCDGRISGSGRIYCSKRCAGAHKEDKFIGAFLSNSLKAGSSTTRALRKYLIRTLGERCQECEWAKKHSITGRVPLEVDHKDGNAENNHPANVWLLCPGCHALTPTFRNLNKGNGRSARRKLPK